MNQAVKRAQHAAARTARACNNEISSGAQARTFEEYSK
jgi:hypothetical protein